MAMMKRYLTRKAMQIGVTLYQPGSIVELADMDARWAADIGVINPDPVGALVPLTRAIATASAKAPSVAPVKRGCNGCGWR